MFVNVQKEGVGGVGRMDPMGGMVTQWGTITDIASSNELVASGTYSKVNGNFVRSDLLFVDHVQAINDPYVFGSGNHSVVYS